VGCMSPSSFISPHLTPCCLQVVTSVTYKTHPNPSHIQVGLMQFNVTTNSTLRLVLQQSLAALPGVTDAGYTGYGTTSITGFSAIFIQPNGTNATFTSAFAPFYKIATLPGVSGQVVNFDFPTWMDYCDVFLQDPNISTNVIDTSRLLTADVLLNHNEALADLVLEYPDMGAGFNFSTSPTLFSRARSNLVFSFCSRKSGGFATRQDCGASDLEGEPGDL